MNIKKLVNMIEACYKSKGWFWQEFRREHAEALAEDLIGELGPTFNEVCEAAFSGPARLLRVFPDGSGSTRLCMGANLDDTVASWTGSDNPGKTAMAAIKAAEPEPTAKEQALEALERLTREERLLKLPFSYRELASDLETIRKALEDG